MGTSTLVPYLWPSPSCEFAKRRNTAWEKVLGTCSWWEEVASGGGTTGGGGFHVGCGNERESRSMVNCRKNERFVCNF